MIKKNFFYTLGIIVVTIFFYKYFLICNENIENFEVEEEYESEIDCENSDISKCVNNAMENNPQMVNMRLNQIDMQINTLNKDVKKLTTNQKGILNKIQIVENEMAKTEKMSK